MKAHLRLIVRQEGASLVEYALLLGMIAVACIAAVTLLGNTFSGFFTEVSEVVSDVETAPVE